jgi:uncharacterized cupredoxin-like copper-binding protein
LLEPPVLAGSPKKSEGYISGSVTFEMNNTGTVTHNFDISGVKAGPFLEPGKSAAMTVNLQAGRSYNFLCDVPGHAAFGMRGTFTPSP